MGVRANFFSSAFFNSRFVCSRGGGRGSRCTTSLALSCKLKIPRGAESSSISHSQEALNLDSFFAPLSFFTFFTLLYSNVCSSWPKEKYLLYLYIPAAAREKLCIPLFNAFSNDRIYEYRATLTLLQTTLLYNRAIVIYSAVYDYRLKVQT